MTRSLLLFAGPMILGNLLQQFYNIVDTWVVGRFVGADALASVGSAYSRSEERRVGKECS